MIVRLKRTLGFTILELLVVVSIMAVIATLATGAALKSMVQSRNKRVDTTVRVLEMALANFRAQENRWPDAFSSSQGHMDGGESHWFHAKDNRLVFLDLYEGGKSGNMVYLDNSSLLASVDGARMTLQDALFGNKEKKISKQDPARISLGYALPSNPDVFCCFCVEYKAITDSVKVHRQDVREAPYHSGNRVDGDHTCPDDYWRKRN
jgi:prepilin-type N-terminal cleavage/methylation domain-containing protein